MSLLSQWELEVVVDSLRYINIVYFDFFEFI